MFACIYSWTLAVTVQRSTVAAAEKTNECMHVSDDFWVSLEGNFPISIPQRPVDALLGCLQICWGLLLQLWKPFMFSAKKGYTKWSINKMKYSHVTIFPNSVSWCRKYIVTSPWSAGTTVQVILIGMPEVQYFPRGSVFAQAAHFGLVQWFSTSWQSHGTLTRC